MRILPLSLFPGDTCDNLHPYSHLPHPSTLTKGSPSPNLFYLYIWEEPSALPLFLNKNQFQVLSKYLLKKTCLHGSLFKWKLFLWKCLKKNHILRNEIKVVCAAKFLADFSYIISCVVVVSKMYQVAKQSIIELHVTVSCYFWVTDLLQLKIYDVCAKQHHITA